MLIETLLFLFLGMMFGIAMGLLPGIHPNMVILLVPFLAGLSLQPVYLAAFLVALGVSNVFIDFIPSMILSAPDSDSALATMPAQHMLAEGKGYEAIKLAILGGFGGILLCASILPILIIAMPQIYRVARPFIWIILSAFVFIMIVREKSNYRRMWALVVLTLAGIIGILSSNLPIDRTFILFPILTGLFGFPQLIKQINSKTNVPQQDYSPLNIKTCKLIRSIGLGTGGGLLSGFLPGVGSSEIASIATIDRNNRSFISIMGAISASNILTSFLALWLIGNPRSGVAVALDQLASVDFNLFLTIVFTSIITASLCVPITFFLSKKILRVLEKINYMHLSKVLFLVLLLAISITTGILGLVVATLCCALGIFTRIVCVKRGALMGVLILPSILFFLEI